MGRRMEIPFVGQEATSRSVAVNNQETVNFILARKSAGAKAPLILESAPGIVDRGTAGDGACRTPHMVNWGGELYGVFGRKLVSIDTAFVVTERGTLNDNSNTCQIARGRNYVMVVDGDTGYTWNGTTFAAIADPDFPDGATHVRYLDGFFLVNDPSTDNWYISALEDPTSWNALDFEAAAVSPDAALAITTSNAIAWVLGDQTAQPYYNSGNYLFPYSLILSAVQDVGIAAPHSVAESDDGIFFLATTPEGGLFVYRIRGQSGQIISGEEQDAYLGSIADPSAAYGFIYKQAGKSFYILQLDPDRPTLVYNISVGAWEKRTLVDGSAWRAGGHGVLGAQRNIIGSRLSARIYELDLDVYDDAGSTFVRRRRTQIYHRAGHRLEFWELVVDCVPGVGNESDPGSDPMIRLRYSDDGGATWGPQMIEPLGKIGETERRAVFRCLGQARNRVFEVEVSDPVKVTIINAYAVVEELLD